MQRMFRLLLVLPVRGALTNDDGARMSISERDAMMRVTLISRASTPLFCAAEAARR